MIRIGVPQSGYNVDRNIPFLDGFQRVRPWDVNRLRTAIGFRLHGRLNSTHQFAWSTPFWPRVDLLHFFNTVSSSKTPWITTYEDIIPRWWANASSNEVEQALHSILSEPCKGIIAFSKATERVAERFFEARGLASEWKAMAYKRHVLHPPQALFDSGDREVGPIRFCFAGGDFYRKGGLEVLRAFSQLDRALKDHWQLTIIGRLDSWGDYASQTTAEDEAKARKIIAENSSQISHFSSLPNQAVIDVFRKSHYFLFPTFQDTYGYAMLEAMAAGCVPIGSATRVLPEVIEHQQNGFLIPLPIDLNGDAHRTATTDEEKSKLVHGVIHTVNEILENHHKDWDVLSENSRRKIATHHDPENHRIALTKIYLNALQ